MIDAVVGNRSSGPFRNLGYQNDVKGVLLCLTGNLGSKRL